MAMIGNKWT